MVVHGGNWQLITDSDTEETIVYSGLDAQGEQASDQVKCQIRTHSVHGQNSPRTRP